MSAPCAEGVGTWETGKSSFPVQVASVCCQRDGGRMGGRGVGWFMDVLWAVGLKSDIFTGEMRYMEVTCMYCETWIMPYDAACL